MSLVSGIKELGSQIKLEDLVSYKKLGI